MKITLPVERTESKYPKIKEDRKPGKKIGELFSEMLKNKGETGAMTTGDNHPIEYIVKPGDNLSKIGKAFLNRDPGQIAKDNGLSNPDLIYPGQKLFIYPAPPKAAQPQATGEVVASWYGQEHHQKTTASGQRFDMNKDTLAHKTLAFGTRVRLTNPENGKTAEGVVNDRGPYRKGRDVDVSYALAKKLGFVRKGVARLDIKII